MKITPKKNQQCLDFGFFSFSFYPIFIESVFTHEIIRTIDRVPKTFFFLLTSKTFVYKQDTEETTHPNCEQLWKRQKKEQTETHSHRLALGVERLL